MKRGVFFLLLLALPASADLIGLELIGPGGFSVLQDGRWEREGIRAEERPMIVPEACPLSVVAAGGAAMMFRRTRRVA